ncbi:MAG: DNA recombination protein RmuC [Planctomycetes bacterium]|nr:DNA recombination protein RmuC [Planctomycetota bacterium]
MTTEIFIGIGIGLALSFLITLIYSKGKEKKLAEQMKETFQSVSMDVLSKNTENFLKVANETLSKQSQLGEKELEGKKRLIDQTLGAMNESLKSDMEKVQTIIGQFEKDRIQKFGELSSQLKLTADQTCRLQETTNRLHTALASTKARGQWGERMAEDVLRLAGFIEGINYQKQKTMATINTRPDYTFLLPQGLKVNMDVKFPLDNYFQYLESESKSDKESYKEQFLRDVRKRIKEVTSRDYINQAENTLDFAIVFIPNEQVYAFINENDRALLDEAIKDKIIICSPLTLYAILAVIRQSVDNFNMEKTASRIIELLNTFAKQWDNFIKSFDRMGKKIKDAQEEFDALSTTRRNQLEKPLRLISELRQEKLIGNAKLISDNDVASENKDETND